MPKSKSKLKNLEIGLWADLTKYQRHYFRDMCKKLNSRTESSESNLMMIMKQINCYFQHVGGYQDI